MKFENLGQMPANPPANEAKESKPDASVQLVGKWRGKKPLKRVNEKAGLIRSRGRILVSEEFTSRLRWLEAWTVVYASVRGGRNALIIGETKDAWFNLPWTTSKL